MVDHYILEGLERSWSDYSRKTNALFFLVYFSKPVEDIGSIHSPKPSRVKKGPNNKLHSILYRESILVLSLFTIYQSNHLTINHNSRARIALPYLMFVAVTQLLPVFNLFRGKNCNIGDVIDYNQRSRLNIGDLIMETLEVSKRLKRQLVSQLIKQSIEMMIG